MFPFRNFFYSVLPQHASSEETLLGNDTSDSDFDGLSKSEGQFASKHRSQSRYNLLWSILKYTHVALTIALGFIVMQRDIHEQDMSRWNANLLYSPAQDAVKYVAKTFTSSHDFGKTKFQGRPSEKNNKEWDNLILRGLTRISAEEAAPMHNKTIPIPDDPEHYIISLAVFHQLHCLNAVRYAVWNETMDAEKERLHRETEVYHLDHCIDLIRQALMCAADITPFVFGRDPRDGKLHGMTSNTHTCRDWDPIEQWAAAHPIVTGYNVTKLIEHDPLGWGDLTYIEDYGEITDWEGQKPDYEAWALGKTHEQHLRGHVGYSDMTNYL
ncbi:MAG: hypothetical protein M1818_006726 [Claussenomyces sp. TS43310]|nr:MAG: hypothetical protein M1818_006726 [Claussenomyces sp. TS43310]